MSQAVSAMHPPSRAPAAIAPQPWRRAGQRTQCEGSPAIDWQRGRQAVGCLRSERVKPSRRNLSWSWWAASMAVSEGERHTAFSPHDAVASRLAQARAPAATLNGRRGRGFRLPTKACGPHRGRACLSAATCQQVGTVRAPSHFRAAPLVMNGGAGAEDVGQLTAEAGLPATRPRHSAMSQSTTWPRQQTAACPPAQPISEWHRAACMCPLGGNQQSVFELGASARST